MNTYIAISARRLTGLATAAALILGSTGCALADTANDCAPAPVYLVISGVTYDRERMAEYGRRLAETGLYRELGAYYLNVPRPMKVLEGSPPDDFVTLIVRFPSLQAVETFWYSDVYQETVKPLRLNPPAADYTVAVYSAAELPAYMLQESAPDREMEKSECGRASVGMPSSAQPRG